MLKSLTRPSLQTLLLFVAIVAVAVALWHRGARRQELLVNGIRNSGGDILYNWQIELNKRDTIANATPPYPKWLVDCFGENYFYSVPFAQLNLSDKPNEPILRYGESLEELYIIRGDPSSVFETAYLPNLRRLDVLVPDIPLDLSFVADLHTLEHISIDATKIEGISTLKGLRFLRSLHLSTNEIESPELLGELTQLTTLSIGALELEPPLTSDEMAKILVKLPNLTRNRTR